MWTPGQLLVFAIVLAIVAGMVFFVRKVRATAALPTKCPSCGASVARNATTCPTCRNTL